MDPRRAEIRPAPRLLEPGAPGFPPELLALARPPARLHVAGRLPDPARAVAVVGSRAATAYGLAVAHRLAADLARLGYAVVSGLARGIDTAAHLGALEAGGTTVAVLPFPIGAVPAPAAALAGRIAAHGALASELDPGTPVWRGVFLERNRLIAALAAATVVVEAAARSGALSTAKAARGLGRPVLAVPGDVDRPTSAGTFALLAAGARPCAAAGDVLAALGRPAAAAATPAAEAAAGPEARVLAALAHGAATADELAQRAGLGAAATLAALTGLELAGLARPGPGPRWRRA